MKPKKYTWGDIAMGGLCLYGLAVSLYAIAWELPRPLQGSGSPAVALVPGNILYRDRKAKERR